MPTAMKIRQCPAWLPGTVWCWPSGLCPLSPPGDAWGPEGEENFLYKFLTLYALRIWMFIYVVWFWIPDLCVHSSGLEGLENVSTVNSRGSTLCGSSQHWAELHIATNDGLFNPAKDSLVAGSPRLPLCVWVRMLCRRISNFRNERAHVGHISVCTCAFLYSSCIAKNADLNRLMASQHHVRLHWWL